MVERSAAAGIWVRSLKMNSKLQQATLNKILRRLEARKLIKAVTSVAYKNRRMFMGFDTAPSKDVTGGVWYSEATLDLAFITHVRKEAVKAVAAAGGGATPAAVAARLAALGVGAGPPPATPLAAGDVAQVLDSLVYEGWLDYAGAGAWRVRALAAAEHAEFPDRRALVDEKMPKRRRARKAGGKAGDAAAAGAGAGAGAALGLSEALLGHDDGGGGGDDDDDAAAAAAAAELPPTAEREFQIIRKNLAHSAAHADHLSAVPCGTCPVAASCKPGGLVSPETCVYISHWLAW
jgi:hypothetical protein